MWHNCVGRPATCTFFEGHEIKGAIDLLDPLTKAFLLYSLTAIALGSSAIVKVSGQNCLRTLYGSLGQIHLGVPKGSAEGSTKVPFRFQQGFTKVPPRFHQARSHQGFSKVPARFQRGSTTRRFPQLLFTFVFQVPPTVKALGSSCLGAN